MQILFFLRKKKISKYFPNHSIREKIPEKPVTSPYVISIKGVSPPIHQSGRHKHTHHSLIGGDFRDLLGLY